MGGDLILRIEDLDPPRCLPGAEREIVDDLRWLGLRWIAGPERGGPHGPYRQSERQDRFAERLNQLVERGLAYPCFCSRREIDEVLSAPHTPFDPLTQYPGTCAHIPSEEAQRRAASEPHAIRFRASGIVRAEDGFAGVITHDLARQPGDFVIRRKDGLVAYQLAVVVDDIDMQVTDVVRGRDLLDSTPRQLALFDAFGAPRPRTWHLPMFVDARGERLSKRAQSVSRAGLEAAGWAAPALIGAVCQLLGWLPEHRSVSADEAIALWDPTTLADDEIRVPDALFTGPEAFAAWSRETSPR